MKGEMYNFRYADDNLFCFQLKVDVLKFQSALKKRLEKFGLKLNEDKTKLCRFGRYARQNAAKCHEIRATFNFLGFTFYNGISRNGKYKVGCRTQSTRLSAAMNRVEIWCRNNRHQAIAWQARYLNAVLRGHYYYYGVTGNFPSVSAFYRHMVEVWRRYLSKRSQRATLNWEKFNKLLGAYPLLKPYLPKSIFC